MKATHLFLIGAILIILSGSSILWMDYRQGAAFQPDPYSTWCCSAKSIPLYPEWLPLITAAGLVTGFATVVWSTFGIIFLPSPKTTPNPCPHYFDDGKCHMLKEQGENCIGYEKCMILRKW